jgi:hypothetical protein
VSSRYCFVDTGAPVSVVSYSVRRGLNYRPIAGIRAASGPNVPAFRFQGVDCDFGVGDLQIVDSRARLRGIYAIEGKFLRRPTRFNQDVFVILGMSFFLNNGGTFEFSRTPAQPWNLTGTVTLP